MLSGLEAAQRVLVACGVRKEESPRRVHLHLDLVLVDGQPVLGDGDSARAGKRRFGG